MLAIAVAAVVVVVLIALIPAFATVLGGVVVFGSIIVFGWGAVGIVAPNTVGLPDRGSAVAAWFVAIVMFVVGAIILPDQSDDPPPTVAGLEVMAEDPEVATAEEYEPAVAVAETASAQPDPALVPERAELSPQPSEPTTEQKLAALDRMNAASDRVDATMSEINRTCTPPASPVAAVAYAKCVGSFLERICPDIGEGALNDMSDAARDMDAPESASLLEQAALDCWTAVSYSDLPSGGAIPRYVGEAVTRMGEKMGEASAMLRQGDPRQ